MSKHTLAADRRAIVKRFVDAEIGRYLAALLDVSISLFMRPCANCGRKFHPRQRWHFLCGIDCRRMWQRGLFRPKDGRCA